MVQWRYGTKHSWKCFKILLASVIVRSVVITLDKWITWKLFRCLMICAVFELVHTINIKYLLPPTVGTIKKNSQSFCYANYALLSIYSYCRWRRGNGVHEYYSWEIGWLLSTKIAYLSLFLLCHTIALCNSGLDYFYLLKATPLPNAVKMCRSILRNVLPSIQ